MSDFSDHFAQTSSNPMILFEDVFYYDTGVLLGRMQSEITKIKGYDGEIPKILEGSHAKLLESMDDYQYVVDSLPQAIQNMDSSELLSVTERMESGNLKMNEASDIMIGQIGK
jgi:hypothetical protein